MVCSPEYSENCFKKTKTVARDGNKIYPAKLLKKLEAAPRVELGMTILQTVALATWLCRLRDAQ
jgi:hypothetical protein